MVGDATKLKGYAYLSTLYSATGARVLRPISGLYRLGIDLGLNKDEITNILNYLEEKGLVIVYHNEDKISITSEGVIAVEQAESRPTDSTVHFPPIMTAKELGKYATSSPRQGSLREVDRAISSAKYPEIKKSVQEIRDSIDKLYLSEDLKSKLISELITVEVQISFPNPDHEIIVNCVSSIRKILVTAPESLTIKRLLSKLAVL